MKYFIFLILLLMYGHSHSLSLCAQRGENGDGNWPIEEARFTKERAHLAAESLAKLMNESENKDDYFAQTYGITWLNAVENERTMIKGFVLKKMALEYPEYRKKEFCDFMAKEAEFQH